jgi:hypothetical protein
MCISFSASLSFINKITRRFEEFTGAKIQENFGYLVNIYIYSGPHKNVYALMFVLLIRVR